MDKQSPRYLRYRQKIGFILESAKLLEIKPKTILENKGQYYVIQSIIDAIIDLVAMIVKDIGQIVKDDYRNIEILVEKNIIPKNIGESLNQANGLRNRIAHHYDDIEIGKVEDSVPLLIVLGTHKFLDNVEAVLNEL